MRCWIALPTMNLGKLWEIVKDRGDWQAAVYALQRVGRDLATKQQQSGCLWGYPGDSGGKSPPANAGGTRDSDLILGREDPLEKGIATRSSILVWEIP